MKITSMVESDIRIKVYLISYYGIRDLNEVDNNDKENGGRPAKEWRNEWEE
jgi:hypothetical protein